MTEVSAVSIEHVRTLVSERQRYDDWLAALEARRTETPVRVFERVHGDYVSRRDAVVVRLAEHVDSLNALVGDLDTRVGSVEEQLSTREDERAEAMLRTAVGEFDAERWEQVRQEVEASIIQLKAERESLLAEVGDVRTLLSSARHVPVKEEPASAPPDTADASHLAHDATSHEMLPEAVLPAVIEPVEVASSAMQTGASRPEALAQASTGHIVSEEQVVGASFSAEPIPADVVVGRTAPSRRDHDADADAAVDALGTMDVYGATGAASKRPAGAGGSERRDPDSVASGGARTAGPGTAGTATRDGFDDLAFLRSVIDPGASTGASQRGTSGSAEQTKTLRCTECGTMNFPTEWYCERCGGELAAF